MCRLFVFRGRILPEAVIIIRETAAEVPVKFQSDAMI